MYLLIINIIINKECNSYYNKIKESKNIKIFVIFLLYFRLYLNIIRKTIFICKGSKMKYI